MWYPLLVRTMKMELFFFICKGYIPTLVGPKKMIRFIYVIGRISNGGKVGVRARIAEKMCAKSIKSEKN